MKNKSIIAFINLIIFSLLAFTLCASEVVIADKTVLTGQFIQGGIIIGKTMPGNKITFAKQAIRVSPEGNFIIGFSRDEPANINLSITTKNGEKISKDLNIEKRKYNIQRIDGLPKSKVSPKKPEVLARIRNEAAQAAQARKRDDERPDYLESFIWPTRGRISGVYGSQRVLNGQAKRPHFGVDIAAVTGTNVVAPASGVITLAYKDMFYSGGTVILDHGHGLSSSFLHLNKLFIKKGDVVKQGDLIAQVGATGRVTGAHLDWRMNLFKRRVDPQLLVPPMETITKSDKKH